MIKNYSPSDVLDPPVVVIENLAPLDFFIVSTKVFAFIQVWHSSVSDKCYIPYILPRLEHVVFEI